MFIKNGFRIIIWEWPFQTASSGVFSFFLYFGIKIRFRQLLGVSALLALWFCIPYDFILLVHINILHNIFAASLLRICTNLLLLLCHRKFLLLLFSSKSRQQAGRKLCLNCWGQAWIYWLFNPSREDKRSSTTQKYKICMDNFWLCHLKNYLRDINSSMQYWMSVRDYWRCEV